MHLRGATAIIYMSSCRHTGGMDKQIFLEEKKMKKILAIVLALVMVLAMVACGEKPAPTPDPDPTGEVYKVAMITDYGDITDQSFNQTTYEA